MKAEELRGIVGFLRLHSGNVFGIGFSVHGTLLASSADDGTVRQ